jgi:hypothetical protein
VSDSNLVLFCIAIRVVHAMLLVLYQLLDIWVPFTEIVSTSWAENPDGFGFVRTSA